MRDAALPMFVTLTYPGRFPSPAEAKKNFVAMAHRLKRAFGGIGLIWKIEPQERGAPHFHLLVWGVTLEELQEFVPGAWFVIAGDGDSNHLFFHQGLLGNEHCVQQVRSYKGVWFYAAKYLGKTFEVEGWKWPGRFWGKINPEKIPFGKFRVEPMRVHQLNDVLRYQRRFAHRSAFKQGLTIFCDADQWVEKLQITGKNGPWSGPDPAEQI